MDSNTQPIIDAVKELSAPAFIGKAELEKLSLVAVPTGRKIEDLTPYLDKLRDAPKRIETTAKVTSVTTLIDYLNRFKMDDSAIFANDAPTNPSLLGIIDFHGGAGGGEFEADSTPGSDALPRFGRHRVGYDFPMSDQIKAWAGIAGKALGHEEMATFLADRQYDITNPPLDWMQVDPATIGLLCHLLNIYDDQGQIDDAAAALEPASEDDDRYVPRSAVYKLRNIRWGSVQRLIQMARTIELSVNMKAAEGYNPKTGERIVQFTEEHETRDSAGRRVTVPDAFLLRIPVWEGETSQLIPVRLQYRKTGGRLSWFMTLVEWRRVIRFAVKTEAERVRDATSLPLFYGAP